jgi:hypothetical protein
MLGCCASPAGAWTEISTVAASRPGVSTCLRAGGGAGLVGVLGPLERRSSAIDLFEADDGGWRRVGRATLGILDVCPSVASNDAGMTVVAGEVRGRLRHGPIRASVRLPGGSFEAPVTVATANGQTASGVATAVSARGDVMVAWAQARRVTRRSSGQVRLVAVRRSAGGAFGELEALSPWRKQGARGTAEVVAAFDADGDATVVWTRGTPSRGPIRVLTTTEVFSAPAGGGFSEPQTLTRRFEDTTTPALAVAPGWESAGRCGWGPRDLRVRAVARSGSFHVAAGYPRSGKRRLTDARDAGRRGCGSELAG